MAGSRFTRSSWIQQRVERFVRAQQFNPNAVRVLAEGDSWLTHPSAAWQGKSVVEHLDAYKTINLVSLAQPGDTLARYPDPPNQQWALACNPAWLDGETYDVVLISGGGNDVLGDRLESMVSERRLDGSYGRQLIVEARLKSTLQGIADEVGRIRHTVDRHLGTDRPIFMHGYDYAQVSGERFELFGGLLSFGPWLQDQLTAKGIEDRDEQQDIVNALIDAFNAQLSELEKRVRAFVHIDLRGLLGPDDWDDEIHPGGRGRQLIAGAIRSAIVGRVS